MARLPRNISSSIDAIARQALGKDWNLYAGLLSHWPEIVGQDYAKTTTPVKITFPKGKKTDEKWAGSHQTGGVLHVRLPQGLAMEFSYRNEQIKHRINDFFGYPAIAKIAQEPYYPDSPAAPPPAVSSKPLTAEEKQALVASTESIEDEDLRAILQTLGESVLKNRP